jgi:hypothetical protein
MVACATRQLQAAVQLGRPWRFEAVLMAVLLEHEKREEVVVKRIEELGGGISIADVVNRTLRGYFEGES